MSNLDKIITPIEGFQYSVNIAYDIYDDKKIRSYIPSNSSLQIIEDILPKSENKQFGLNISLTSNKELIINGTSEDFIELSDLLVSLAMSKTNDHHHIDELTLINDNSSIKEIIIEKK